MRQSDGNPPDFTCQFSGRCSAPRPANQDLADFQSTSKKGSVGAVAFSRCPTIGIDQERETFSEQKL
jgi:hypothetical protein